MCSILLALGDLTAVVSAIAGVIAVAFIIVELRHMDKHKDLEISMKLFELAETDRLRSAFRWIEEEFKFESLEEYKAKLDKDSETGEYPYRVEAFFEEVGFLVNKKLVDIDVIVDRLGSLMISNWLKLKPWILAVRNERGDKSFGEHFERLYEKTVVYMKKP
ncbi:MAG TPA: hypothetical protein VF893_01990 [Candidatus Bathyarchaeia archaeon]